MAKEKINLRSSSTDSSSTDSASINSASINSASIDSTSTDSASSDSSSTDSASTDSASTNSASIDSASTNSSNTDSASASSTSTNREKRERTRFLGVYQLTSKVKRHDGKADICFYYSFKSHGGKKIWKKVGWRSEGYTAQLTSQRRAEAIQEQRDGKSLSSVIKSCLSFAEAFAIFDKKWLTVSVKNPHKERGRYNYHVRDAFGERRLDGISTLDLESYKAALYVRGLSAASIRHILGDIRRVYRKMMEWGLYTGFDPTQKLSLPKADNARTRHLTPDEASKLLLELQGRSETWHDIALLSLHTGMRLSEILNLEAQDIDLQNRTIRVRDGKTGSRTVHMTTTVYDVISGRLMPTAQSSPIQSSTTKSSPIQSPTIKSSPIQSPTIKISPTSLLFPGRDGHRLTSDATSNTFARSVKACGFNPEGTDRRNRVSFHTLRHTFCSWLAMRGVPLYTIGQLVGHASPEMTKRYAHLSPSASKDAVINIEAMLNPKS